ncbi:MAG TPA: phage portal protein [Thermoleophilia bacterium]|nr:phage portal protein [Thermoleophilia bacterium]
MPKPLLRRILRAWSELRGTGSDAFWARWIEGNTTQGASGEVVNAETALKFTAFYSAVDLISRDIAKLPLKVYQSTDRLREVARSHPVHSLISTNPNPEQTSFIFRQTMQSDALRWGNAYAEIVRNGAGQPAELWPIDPETMTPERHNGVLYYVQRGTSGMGAVDADRILHIRGLGDGMVGKSPVALFREAIGMGLAAERAGSALLGSGFRPGGVLEHPGQLGDLAFSHLKESMEKQASGSGKQGRLLIAEEGMKYATLAIDPKDAQYLETRVHQVREIARIFHIPPHKLADLADATFSNVEEQNQEYVDDCLSPWLVQWEQELARKLLNEQERQTLYMKHELGGLLRGNAATRSAFYSSMFNIGAFSINDILEREDMNPIEGGDEHYVPVNLAPSSGPVDDENRAVLLEASARISRERERSGKGGSDQRHIALLIAPIMAAASSVGAHVEARAVAVAMLAEVEPDAMVARAVGMIEGTRK